MDEREIGRLQSIEQRNEEEGQADRWREKNPQI